jgi:glutamate racemase
MTDGRPLGVFDSGTGGLTVVRSILDDLPHESVIYFGDHGHFPYGPRPLGEVRGYALGIARYLVERGVKLLVIACNTATSAALDDVRAAVPVPVIGVVEPAVRAAIRATRNGRVGLIGTVGTIASGSYQRAFDRARAELSDPQAAAGLRLEARACPRFVEFVEAGDTTSHDLLGTAAEYLAPLRAAEVDTLILGCTHYPLLRGALHHVMGPDVLLVSSADETASDVYDVLAAEGLLANGDPDPMHEFVTSGDPGAFSTLGRRFLGPEFLHARRVELEPARSG